MKTRTSPAPAHSPSGVTLRRSPLLQRSCACGGGAGMSGECETCRQKTLQKKLSVGSSNDPLEQEADRAADQALAAAPHAAAARATPHIQRLASQPLAHAGMAPASVDNTLSEAGTPMVPTLRRDMEQRFGHDFSRVRIHAGGSAQQSTRDVSARAYTVGEHIAFNAGQFAPDTRQGQRLIAHELAHVIQQGASPQAGLLQRDTAPGECEAARNEQDPGKMRDPEEVKVLCAADRARKNAKDDTRMMLSASEIVYRLARLYLPKQADQIGAVGFSAAQEGVRVETSPNSISITVGRQFVLGTTGETLLKRVIELRSAILAKTQGKEADYAKGHGLLHHLASAHTEADTSAAPGSAKPAEPKPYKQDALDGVAIPALKDILCRTKRTGREHCGNIIRSDDGTLRATGPHRGDVGICGAVDRPRPGDQLVAYYHSHPEGQGLGFSKPGMNGRTVGDTEEAEDRRIDYYLINSEGGMLRYIPSRDEYRAGKHVDLGSSGVTCPQEGGGAP